MLYSGLIGGEPPPPQELVSLSLQLALRSSAVVAALRVWVYCSRDEQPRLGIAPVANSTSRALASLAFACSLAVGVVGNNTAG